MITAKQKNRIREMWAKQDEFRHLVTFWQDYFYSGSKYFGYGYPVCVQLQNSGTQQVEMSLVVDYHTSQAGCEAELERVDAYIAELDATRGVGI